MHLVMFDIDGTLISNSGSELRLFKQALNEALELDCPDNWEGITHVTGTGIVAELMMQQKEREITPKEHDKMRDHFIDLLMDELMDNPEGFPAIKGGVDMVTRLLSDENYMVAVATGTWGPIACFKLASAGYDIEKMIMATGDDDFDRMEIMLLARERAEDKLLDEKGFESVTYIGDGPWDQLASKGLGWRFIGIGDLVKDADLHIDDYEGKANLIMNLH